MPGISQVPILGKLFQSRSMNKSEDELVIVVTPRIVHPATDPGVPNLEPKFAYPFMAPQASNMPPPTGAVTK
jgi:pilus assembly protein CpaC